MYLQCLFLLIQRTGGRSSSTNFAAASDLALADFLDFFFFFFFCADVGVSGTSSRVGELDPDIIEVGVNKLESSTSGESNVSA